jgi:YD repeat-containing protein
VYLDAADHSVNTAEAYAKVTYRYDMRGHLSEVSFFDAQDQPTRRQGGYAQICRTYDARGQLVEETLFDPQGNPARHDDGYVKVTYTYDDRGYSIEQAWFDQHGQPTLRSGKVVQRAYFDPDDRLVRWVCHAAVDVQRERPVAGDHLLWAQWWPCPSRGRIREGETDLRCAQTVYGYAIRRFAYDAWGRETRREFLNVNKAPVHARVAIREFEPGSNGRRLGLHVGDLLLNGLMYSYRAQYALIAT